LGASLGDLLSQAPEYGGVGWGTVNTSIVFLAAITSLVVMVSRRHNRLQSPHFER